MLAAEWQLVSQPDRQSGADMSQAGLEALLLSLPGWGIPALFAACSGAVLVSIISDKATQEQEAAEAVTKAAER